MSYMMRIYADHSSLLLLLSDVVLKTITKRDRASMNHYELPTDLILESPISRLAADGSAWNASIPELSDQLSPNAQWRALEECNYI